VPFLPSRQSAARSHDLTMQLRCALHLREATTARAVRDVAAQEQQGWPESNYQLFEKENRRLASRMKAITLFVTLLISER
jgi:hypothetical protein